MSRKRTAGRLEGTHALLGDRLPEARPGGGFLYEIDVASEEFGQAVAQGLQPAEMIEAARREASTGSYGQVHIGGAGFFVAGE